MLHSRRRSRHTSDLPRNWARAGRLLIWINILVLVLSSFTEHLWTWDRFLRGGQDFELSLLALLAFFCLILVLAHYFRRRFSELLDRRPAACFARNLSEPPSSSAPSLAILSSRRPPGAHSSAALSSVILRI